MDELLEQFLLESRELAAQATDDLLALEKSPEDRARIDRVLRAFHTLKGAAGIIDFGAMARALHATEDVLAGVRSGNALSAMIVENCLFCLDQVGRWLDTIEATGAPPADAADAAAAVIARFHGEDGAARGAPPLIDIADHDWLSGLLKARADLAAAAVSAVRYRPHPDCFFRGEDPVAIVADLPNILAIDVVPTVPVPDLAAFNPLRCELEISILSSEAPDSLRTAFSTVSGRAFVTPVARPALPVAVRSMLEAQLAVLADAAVEGLAGRVRSAGAVVRNIVRRIGSQGDLEPIEGAITAAIAASNPALLADAIHQVLDGAGVVTAAPAVPSEAPAVAARSLRVDVERIERLVTITGELIVLKNAIGYSAHLAQSDPAGLAARLKDQHAALDRLTNALREAVLGARVVPFRTIFQRFPRLVRDLGVSLGKELAVSMAGEDSEADKAVVEALFEPILHLVRNAADHGIEPAEVRRSRGKSMTGTIHLSAARDGEQMVIEVGDDGGGVDTPKIRQLAVERGVATAELLSSMTDDEVIDVIFAPGFSTADDVTDVSGRGVGMDAVRSAVERLGGRVMVRSVPGAGSKVTLRLPLTVMVTRLMTIDVGGQPFGVPLESVVETVLVARDQIKPIGAASAFVLRDRTVPLINLRAALGDGVNVRQSAAARVVILSFGGMLGAIEVDRLGDRLDAIVKPIGGLLDGADGIAGTTLLGDGRVLIVLDLREILS